MMAADPLRAFTPSTVRRRMLPHEKAPTAGLIAAPYSRTAGSAGFDQISGQIASSSLYASPTLNNAALRAADGPSAHTHAHSAGPGTTAPRDATVTAVHRKAAESARLLARRGSR